MASASLPCVGCARTVEPTWTSSHACASARRACCAAPAQDARARIPNVPPHEYRRLAKRPQIRRLPNSRPLVVDHNERSHRHRPEQTVTDPCPSLGQNRHDIQLAADAMGLRLHGWQTIVDEWTDERIRQAYLYDDRSLAELADEMGVSIGTLSNPATGPASEAATRRD